MPRDVKPVYGVRRRAAAERILVLDGAMGTMIQALKLDEEGYRGARFDAWNREVRGNNDLLNPEPAGRDPRHPSRLFPRRRRHRLDQHVLLDRDRAGRLRHGGHRLRAQPRGRAAGARGGDRAPRTKTASARFVAGALGPTNRTASISPDVTNPGFRAVTFDQLRAAYGEQVRGLLDGGADLLLIETIFDTLNAKAAIYAIAELCDERGVDVPVMISGTITDLSGRLLSGQTPAAFWNSVRHAQAGHGRPQLRARRQGDARAHRRDRRASPTRFVCAYPNAGLPNEFGYYDESPEFMAELLGEFADAGLVNIVGGCCGTTPEHIRAIAEAVARQDAARDSRDAAADAAALRARAVHARRRKFRFVNVGERTNVTGSAKFRKLVTAGDYAAALDDRARPGRERRADHRRQHGRGPARFREARW